MGIIFDLDQTLVDSTIAKNLRTERNWNEVYKAITQFNLYSGVLDVLQDLNARHIPTAIVTSSPRPYCIRVIDQFSLPINYTVCFHDTKKHKPDPDPILLAVKKMNNTSFPILSFGDEQKDIIASNNANVISVACTWDADDIPKLLSASPKHICNTVLDMQHLISTYFGL